MLSQAAMETGTISSSEHAANVVEEGETCPVCQDAFSSGTALGAAGGLCVCARAGEGGNLPLATRAQKCRREGAAAVRPATVFCFLCLFVCGSASAVLDGVQAPFFLPWLTGCS